MKFYELTVDTIFMRGNFKGKMTRSDYWLYFLFIYLWIAIFAAGMGLIATLFRSPGATAGMFPVTVFLLVSLIAASARRLHDVGKSGWWQLVPLYSLFLYLQPSLESGSISTPANYDHS
jgi:uncharacterized membrane protein YhaH (DUF805 family)